MSKLFPIFLNLKDRDCLVVGGGNVALRKVRPLLECGANVRVISMDLNGEMYTLVEEGRINWEEKNFQGTDLGNPFLVISATDDKSVNSEVVRLCNEKNIPVNVVDNPERCSFQVPAVVRRGELAIAVSTGGRSPLLARELRKELESQFGEEYAAYIELLGEARKRVLRDVHHEEERRSIFEDLVNSGLLDLIRDGREQEARDRMELLIRK